MAYKWDLLTVFLIVSINTFAVHLSLTYMYIWEDITKELRILNKIIKSFYGCTIVYNVYFYNIDKYLINVW